MIDFTPKQKKVWRHTIDECHRWNFSYGATRSGKTYLDYYKIPYRIRRASTEGLILLLGNTKSTLERNIITPLRGMWGDSLVGHVSNDNRIKLFGRDCYALGADKISQVARIQGVGLSYAYGDEVTTWHPDVFQMLKSRLDKPGACFDGTCNPDSPEHWAKLFIDSDADVYSMGFEIDDNTFLEPTFVDNLKKEYAGTVYYDRFIRGLWTKAEGLVYPFFVKNMHTISGAIAPARSYYISVDYGTVNPFSAGLWGVTGTQAIRENEFYYDSRKKLKQKTDEEYYADLEKLAYGKYIEYVVVDPSAASFIETIRRHSRFRVRAAENDVLNGIRVTASLLQGGFIKIHQNCKDAIREFGLYSWDPKAKTDTVLKTDDHAMDEMRYFCATVLSRALRWIDWGK